MRNRPGVYALILYAEESRPVLVDDRHYEFPAGWYAYVGRARGSGGLAGSVPRRPPIATNPRRHLDRLLKHFRSDEVWYSEGPKGNEHVWTIFLNLMPEARIPVRGFGATGCTSGCPAHVFHFPQKPSVAAFRARAGYAGSYHLLVDFMADPSEAIARLGTEASPSAISYERGRRYLEERRRVAAFSDGKDDPLGAWESLTAFGNDQIGQKLAELLAGAYGIAIEEYRTEAMLAERFEMVATSDGPDAMYALLNRGVRR